MSADIWTGDWRRQEGKFMPYFFGLFGKSMRQQEIRPSPIPAPAGYTPSEDLMHNIREAIYDCLGLDVVSAKAYPELTPDFVPAKDFGIDSLAAAKLVLELEDQFDVVIPDEDAENLVHQGTTLRDICYYFEQRG